MELAIIVFLVLLVGFLWHTLYMTNVELKTTKEKLRTTELNLDWFRHTEYLERKNDDLLIKNGDLREELRKLKEGKTNETSN